MEVEEGCSENIAMSFSDFLAAPQSSSLLFGLAHVLKGAERFVDLAPLWSTNVFLLISTKTALEHVQLFRFSFFFFFKCNTSDFAEIG